MNEKPIMPTEEMQQLPDAPESTAMTVPTTKTQSNPSTATATTNSRKKRKRKPKRKIITHQFTIRNPPWAYIHLQHLTSTPTDVSSSEPHLLDAVTAHLDLKAALSRFLGLHGEAVSIDILKLEGDDVWIRVPAEDKIMLVAAAGGWVSGKGEGWRVKGTSSWDARAWGRDGGGQDLFHD